ncbi:GH25 family lysozyme [Enterococcus dongliensis]|uniref:GH25 family lysozyme n=1 Tax=Enterococcus dongliensis TaxID=2559925 RepID=UPI00288CDC11|nr:GH25 family lysozyme [Enterococcus dongliensis]MDT2604678.1 GH25 family lysozyme [Enterococcus dongliensis]MDT2645869.1 GH25 family lysozyme [Enterococcus dongliensis]MDT2712164.1 GH25 family lysozyme [Enterococcus dongliensis]
MKKKFLLGAVAALFLLPFFPTNVEAAKGDQGVDWAVYQGAQGQFGYAHDKFAIAQIGGYNAGGLYDQWTYQSQVNSALAQGKRAHTYIWYDTWGNMSIAKTTMDYFLPKVKTPRGSIVALDFEHGASSNKQANTDTILYGMRRIRDAGYTPMYYSYKPFTLANVYYQQILAEFPDSLWIGAYPDYNVTPYPNYNYFPSMDGVAIYQFTSTYVGGGLDGNIDLTGITDNGYSTLPDPNPAEVTDVYRAGQNYSVMEVKADKGHVDGFGAVSGRIKVEGWSTRTHKHQYAFILDRTNGKELKRIKLKDLPRADAAKVYNRNDVAGFNIEFNQKDVKGHSIVIMIRSTNDPKGDVKGGFNDLTETRWYLDV